MDERSSASGITPPGDAVPPGPPGESELSVDPQSERLLRDAQQSIATYRDRLLAHPRSRLIEPELWESLEVREDDPEAKQRDEYTRRLWTEPLDEETAILLIPDPEDYTPEQLLVLQQLSSPDRSEDLERLLEAVRQNPRTGLFYGFLAMEASGGRGTAIIESWQGLHGVERDVFSRILEDFDKIHRHFRQDYAATIPPKVLAIGQQRAEALLSGAMELIQNQQLVETLYPDKLESDVVKEFGSKRGLLLSTLVGEALDALEDLMLPGEGFAGWDMKKLSQYAERLPANSPLQAAVQTFVEA